MLHIYTINYNTQSVSNDGKTIILYFLQSYIDISYIYVEIWTVEINHTSTDLLLYTL